MSFRGRFSMYTCSILDETKLNPGQATEHAMLCEKTCEKTITWNHWKSRVSKKEQTNAKQVNFILTPMQKNRANNEFLFHLNCVGLLWWIKTKIFLFSLSYLFLIFLYSVLTIEYAGVEWARQKFL